MELPARDVKFLNERGLDWELLPDPQGAACLIVKNFSVAAGGFTPAATELMIRIPPQYPMTPLDMWYCDPPIRLVASGQFAPASEVMESHLARSWQRFSRHLNGGWRPGVDSLRSYFTLIQRELQGAARS
ncbi:E2/UBC family protein [Acidovorax radicis]|uniref:E2/UBC family protein n=1 Tax=Acidovorax radicis TaxID=758826 RepID=UPI0009DABA1E